MRFENSEHTVADFDLMKKIQSLYSEHKILSKIAYGCKLSTIALGRCYVTLSKPRGVKIVQVVRINNIHNLILDITFNQSFV